MIAHQRSECLAILLSLAVMFAAGNNTSTTDAGMLVTDNESGGSDKATEKPDFRLTSKAYAQEYWDKDKEAFQAKYNDKLVELTGRVIDVGQNRGRWCLTLEGRDAEDEIMCYTRDKNIWRLVLPGQIVKLRGKGGKPFGMVYECAIVEAKGNVPPTLSADQLAKECAADREAAEKKYKGTHLILTGEIGSIAFHDAGGERDVLVTIILKADAVKNPTIEGWFYDIVKPQMRALKIGQKVTVLGQYFRTADIDKVVLLYPATLLESQ